MIAPLILLHKRNLDIPKLVRTAMNQTVTTMKVNEHNIWLTKGARLNVGVLNYSMISEKLM
jgi:hypothetical protein